MMTSQTDPHALTRCQNCHAERTESDLDAIDDLFDRVAPGEPMPAGQCPDCGALAQPMPDPSAGPSIMAPEPPPRVDPGPVIMATPAAPIMATVYIVSLEWNEPPAEVTGETGIVGVYATKDAADLAAAEERRRLSADERLNVYYYDLIENAYCPYCGTENARDPMGKVLPCPTCTPDDDAGESWCGHCGAELKTTGTCDNDHDEWDIDVHVTQHAVQEAP